MTRPTWYSIVLFLLLCAVTNGQEMDKMRSTLAAVKPNSYQVNERGNVVVNARIDSELAGQFVSDESFRITSLIKNRTDLSIVVCLDSTGVGCQQARGLVLCWNTNRIPGDGYPSESNDSPSFKFLADKCGDDKNGIVVTTNGDNFTIETRYGNSYTFPIPSDKCFVLWLANDINLKSEVPMDDEEVNFSRWVPNFEEYKDYPVEALTRMGKINRNASGGSTFPYPGDWRQLIRYQNKSAVEMLYKEIIAHVEVQEIYSLSYFYAYGGGPCCHLTAMVMGEDVLKCYFKWVLVKSSICSNMHRKKGLKCPFNYTVSYKMQTTEVEQANNAHQQSNGTKEEQEKKFGKSITTEVSAETAEQIAKETIKDYLKQLTDTEVDSNDLKVKFKTGATIPLGEVANASADFAIDYDKHHEKKIEDLTKDQVTNSMKQIMSKKFFEKVATTVNEDSRALFDKTFSKLVSSNEAYSLSTDITNNTVVSFNDDLEAAYRQTTAKYQLLGICLGIERTTNLLLPFSDDPAIIAEAERIDRKNGWPEWTNGSECIEQNKLF